MLLLELPKVDRERLPEWLAERLSRQGQRASRPMLALIADRTEGNLLAAHQELQRLALLLPQGELDPAQVERIVLDSARYDIFGLVDTALAGETARGLRMVDSLRAEDAAAAAAGLGARRLPAPLPQGPRGDGRRPAGAVGIAQRRHLRQARGGLQAGPQAARRGRALRLLRETAHLDRMAKGVGGLAGTGAPAAFGGSDDESQWAAVERIVIGLAGTTRLAA